MPVSRSALPQNFMDKPATFVDDFSSSAAWTVVTGATVADDTVNVLTGTKSTKLVSTNLSAGAATVDKTIPNSTFGDRRIYFKFYIPDNPDTTISSIYFYFASNAWSKYFQCIVNGPVLRQGWNYLTLTPNDVASYSGGENWDSTFNKIRITVWPKTGQTATVSFDAMYCNGIGKPKIVLTFDDAFLSVYQYAFPYMQSKGIRATMYTIPKFLRDSGDPLHGNDYMSQSEIREMDAAGWCIANHTINHAFYLTSSYTVADYKDKVKQCIDWLNANGYSKGAYHIAFPKGEYDAGVLQAMKELGMKTCRTVRDGQVPTYAIDDLYQLVQKPLWSGATVATATGYVDAAIASGMTQFIMGHQVPIDDTQTTFGTVPSIAYSQSKFQQFIDYAVERKVEFITIDEWYEGLKNPRYRHVPLAR